MATFAALLAGSFILGALHAVEPGHGKTLVAAYLVGARGRWYHAVYLGLVVTLTHTAGIYLIGLLAILGLSALGPEEVARWIQVGSGVLITLVGAWMLYRLGHGHHHHDHDHGHGHTHSHGLGHHHHHHDHDHDHGQHHHDGHGHHHEHAPAAVRAPLSKWGLTLLGITGGLMPCPAAVAPLLGGMSLAHEHAPAVATHHHHDGVAHTHDVRQPTAATFAWSSLLPVVAFSAGLATTLTLIGLFVLRARQALENRLSGARWLTYVPLFSAVVVTTFGILLIAQGLFLGGASGYTSWHSH